MSATTSHAARAYRAAIAHRSLRDQEADVFRQVIGALRTAHTANAGSVARAIADNRRLWDAVMDLLRDPTNRLPEALRAGLLSIGHAVQREMRQASPDITFLIDVNQQIVAGLST